MQTAIERQHPVPGFQAAATENADVSSGLLHDPTTRANYRPPVSCRCTTSTGRSADRIGFAIGWDYGAHGLRPPDGAGEAVQQGYTAALTRFRVAREHDRFVRKWLLLRHNAWLRGRLVDEAVTPAYLRSIDVDRCPVTLQPLTYATGADSDWSVDRLNNDAGYAPGNLAVISTRANRAKGTKDFAEVRALAAPETAAGGLNAAEWSRLASLMLGPCFATDPACAPLHPLVALAPRTVRTASQQLKLALLVHRWGGVGSPLGKLKALSAELGAGQTFHRLVKRIRRHCERGRPVAEAFADAATFGFFGAWFDALGNHGAIARAESLATRTLERGQRPGACDDAWGLDSLGYEVRP